MNRYVLGVDAHLDLDEIWEYIARDSVEAADRWIGKLFTPYPVLFWPVGAYPVIYRAERPVEIVAVTRGSRDVPIFLRRRMH